eukprot:7256646-Lingulodinium_polyedra.AAC.1
MPPSPGRRRCAAWGTCTRASWTTCPRSWASASSDVGHHRPAGLRPQHRAHGVLRLSCGDGRRATP